MNDKYVRPPMEEPDKRISPIDIILGIMLIVSILFLMWSFIFAVHISTRNVDEQPPEIIESAEPEKIDNVVSGSIPLNPVEVELGSVEDPTLTVEPEPTVLYYDIPLDEKLQDHIFAVCEEYHIEPTLVFAVIERESKYRSDVVGDNGRSFGLMQIQKRWHKDRMSKLGVTNLLDPYQNVRVGIDYLAELFDRSQDVEWVLMAYNGGPSYANYWCGRGVVSTYAVNVLEGAREIRERSNI